MTEVSFHFNVPDPSVYVCRLLRKAARQGTAVVVTGALPTLDELDAALWTFDPIEFLPHLMVRGAEAPPERLRATPVWLAADPSLAPRQEVLVNLGEATPRGFESFGRLIEIVSRTDHDRAAARDRWKHYAGRGYPIQRHDVSDEGERNRAAE